jgi:hypothetical protein
MKWKEKAAVGLLETRKVSEFHQDYTVRIYADRIAIQSAECDPISWEVLQRIKQRILGEVFAVEVFPATESEVVNLRNTRHLWFGPEISKIQAVLNHPEFTK